ncbi:carbonate dehydratase [Pseudoduganella sp. SL102]|uniref:Carbonic anhydrase 2 n=1 Tax=Pseudoduganella albidiflava TaxID=321983 RepID=A0A411WRY0_9BURK|nr:MULTISPECIES: carbonate dehydratase [Pseudoduganella]QBH99534.1 carbonate dehydratase [Pseudoduganella albidiflava]WBS02511.1 carbonate dehydratase [Pseudoduganella sp. SL102]GGY45573.1 carbonic anhydrase [Pseudoduganella albidiflava]
MNDTKPSDLRELLNNNRRWADSMVARDPEFFQRLANQASPEYLWIGCSDSRVPANELLGLLPGDVFVHRNIANVVVHSDLNCLSVLQFAIEVLKVKHVIIVGHYGCKGVHAALTGARVGLVDNWLRHVADVSQKHERYLGTVLDERVRSEKLVELNVVEQVVNVSSTTILRDAWDRGQQVTVHGWVYGINDGHLHDLGMTITQFSELQEKLKDRLSNNYSAA